MRPLLTLLFSTFTTLIFAQHEGLMQTDSLKRQLLIAQPDTTLVLILAKLSEGYRGSKPDSAMFYGKRALTMARQIKFHKGEVNALLSIAVVQRELGNLPSALAVAYKALQIAEDQHYRHEQIWSLLRIGNVYLASKNYPKALEYYKLAEKKQQLVKDEDQLAVTQMLIGDVYEQTNKLDSAWYYEQLVYKKMFQLKDKALVSAVLRILGDIQVKLKNYQLALEHYQQGLKIALENGDYRNASTISTNVASFYKNVNRIDSAIYYAKQGLALGQRLSYKNRIMAAGNLLAELYEPIDSKEALRYYKLATAAKDSLYGAEKAQAMQTMTFDEEERRREIEAAKIAHGNMLKQYALVAGIAVFLMIALILYNNNLQKQKAYISLEQQKMATDQQKLKAEQALTELKATQRQLIQQEKMASLGELTAGIAHEIQNPLNFVNNFSEVSTELVDELKEEIGDGKNEEAIAIAEDIKENLEKVVHHGKRADAIVKGMLQHSRANTGKKELTDINALADEYLRLSYHGLRAKDKLFNATIETHFDESVGKIDVVPQDIGRVLLNLFNNAFYAVTDKKKQSGDGYEPIVSVSTKREGDKVIITVRDNGPGIPQKAVDKIFQPFFTTKPTGQGTGLGLSLSYDIIKAHGGELRVETKEGEGAEFIIILKETL